MRIGYDATALLPPRTGVGHYTARLLAGLLQHHPEAEYRLFSKRPLPNLDPELAGARLIPGYLQRSHWLWLQLRLPALLAAHAVDLAHFTNELAPLRTGRPYVLTLHDASLFLYGRYHPRWRRWSRRWLIPLVARRAAAVICDSNAARRDLQRILGLEDGRCHVVPLAPPPHFAPESDSARLDALRQRYALPPDYWLFVGSLEPRKNLARLLRALAQLHRAGHRLPLLLVGPAGWLMGDFQQQAAALGLADAVRPLGYVPTAELPGLYSLATALVFPSLYEGFGLPVLEAMACGAPVLTSQTGALAEVAGDAAELVDPIDEASIVVGLRRLATNPTRRAELVERGLARAAQFSWARTARATMKVYEGVVG